MESTSSELDSVLSTFREDVFLPAHLTRTHRKRVFNRKIATKLEEEPVKVDVSGEEFRLRHVEKTRQPDSVKGLFQAVSLMKDKKDWDNLPIIFEGMKTAGRKYKLHHLEKLVRKAGMAGRQDAILECARRVSKTDFVLRDASLVRQVMWWIQYKAVSNDWDAKNTQRALSIAEQISVLLEDPIHSGSRTIQSPDDARVRPEVVGILLELAAANAKQNGSDADGKVQLYAERLINIMRDGRTWDNALPKEDGWEGRNHWLRYATAILYGLKIAPEVLADAKLQKELKALGSKLQNVVARERKILATEIPEGAAPLGVWSYNKLVGAQS